MTDSEIDWERLERLRARFLKPPDGRRGVADYWRVNADLEVYDRVLAARIGWKWEAVLAEVGATLARSPGIVLDWGCGTGIATRRVLAHLVAAAGEPLDSSTRVILHDRSATARRFAAAAVRADFDRVDVRLAADGTEEFRSIRPDLLLCSHVLGELDTAGVRSLVDIVGRSRDILWVEPGTRAISRRMATIRDSVLVDFDLLAPCPHQGPCSALRSDREHWCHFFAKPPASVFQDADWHEVGRRLGIDLRALPYAFLHLRRRTAHAPTRDDRGGVRPLGRPDVRTKVLRFHGCSRSGIHRYEVFKGTDKSLYRQLKRDPPRFVDPRRPVDPP